LILVTGGAGYIGSHCVLDLIKNGYDVVIFDNLSTGHIETIQALKNFECSGQVADFIKGDLRNLEDVAHVFKEHRINAVIHFAAMSLVGESVEDPQKYYRNNLVGTLNLLDMMLKYDVKNIVFSSTCAVYGEPQYVPIDEMHIRSPINPYGKSKLAVENVLEDYSKAYGVNHIIFRYFNAFGASEEGIIGEWHDIETHLVPNIIKSTLGTSKTFEIYGNDYSTPDGTCIRDYINIEDLARAHRLAYEYLKMSNFAGSSHVFNLGTEHGYSVKDIFHMCEKILEKKIPFKICPRREGDPAKLVANANRAKQILNWEAKEPIDKSIITAYVWEKQLRKIRNQNSLGEKS